MFELLALVIEGIVDVVSELLEDGADVDSAVLDDQTVLPAAASGFEVGSGDLGGGGSSAGGWLAATDGGISPDRFDPKPMPGIFSP